METSPLSHEFKSKSRHEDSLQSNENDEDSNKSTISVFCLRAFSFSTEGELLLLTVIRRKIKFVPVIMLQKKFVSLILKRSSLTSFQRTLCKLVVSQCNFRLPHSPSNLTQLTPHITFKSRKLKCV